MIVAVRIVMSNPMIDHHHPGTRTAMFTCQKMTQTVSDTSRSQAILPAGPTLRV